MHIQLIPACEGIARLKATQKHLETRGVDTRIINAEAYSDQGLLVIMDVVVSSGHRTLLVDSCTRGQIDAVLIWQSETEDCVDFKDLVIHLVRKDQT
ncbi:hypothetical protein PSCICO_15230 [Pseudomonas cichorii]|uniref:hypothetical protein n=1 Tax=Pseudomonas cichorii TaxID=36746 RepID=UPI00190FD0B7|nr:hypothetical protein [Pseudomonas cichorii]GFM86124.1 hypothetical protein PSCICO_15230 [Pseudomonas cichorii]